MRVRRQVGWLANLLHLRGFMLRWFLLLSHHHVAASLMINVILSAVLIDVLTLVHAIVNSVVESMMDMASFGAVVLDRQQILLALLAVHLAAIVGVRLRPWFLIFLLTASLRLLSAILCLNLHVSVDRVLILLPKQTGIVLSKISLLPLADLATHDEPRAKLNGLRIDEARGGPGRLARDQFFLARNLERIWWRLCAVHPVLAVLES